MITGCEAAALRTSLDQLRSRPWWRRWFHELDALIDRQSMESEPEKRRRLVWDIEKKLIEHDVRPVLFRPRATVCNQPWVKGMTQMVNGIHNGSRFEDVWLDK